MTGPLRGIGRAGSLLLALGMVLTAAACGATPIASGADETTTATTTTTETTTSSTPSPTTTSSATSSSEGGGGPQPGDEGRPLTLGDFFNPSTAWEENRYDIADKKDVPGIAAQIDSCYGPDQELELRLANNFETLDFSVAQGNDSMDSDQAVSVTVLANNVQVEIRSVPFNETQTFEVPVSGVNALKIQLTLDDRVQPCGGSVIAVLTDITVE